MTGDRMVHPDLPDQEITVIGAAAQARRKSGWITTEEAQRAGITTAATEAPPEPPKPAAAPTRRITSPTSGPDKEQ